MADLAFAFKWPPSELDALPVADVLMWHAQIARIGQELKKGNQR